MDVRILNKLFRDVEEGTMKTSITLRAYIVKVNNFLNFHERNAKSNKQDE